MVSIDRRPQIYFRISSEDMKSRPPAISILQLWETPITDATHILLSSDRADQELIEGIDFAYQVCPFPNSPSRFPDGHPHHIPLSGLERKRLGENYGTILSIIADLRNAYINNVLEPGKLTLPKPLNADELRSFLRGLMYLPHYLSLRAKDPIPPQGELHPSIILLSNSASGTLGALQAYIERYGETPDTLQKIPNAQDMIDAAEAKGTMVGSKTVCVASPEQMRHFMNAVIYGPQHVDRKLDVSSFFDASEVRSFIIFGNEVYSTNNTLSAFKTLDQLTAQTVEPHMKKRHNYRKIKPYIDDFVRQSEAVITNLSMRELLINLALGRGRESPQLTLDMFEAQGFKMPAILRQLRQ